MGKEWQTELRAVTCSSCTRIKASVSFLFLMDHHHNVRGCVGWMDCRCGGMAVDGVWKGGSVIIKPEARKGLVCLGVRVLGWVGFGVGSEFETRK
jgi:hypothetical protein